MPAALWTAFPVKGAGLLSTADVPAAAGVSVVAVPEGAGDVVVLELDDAAAAFTEGVEMDAVFELPADFETLVVTVETAFVDVVDFDPTAPGAGA